MATEHHVTLASSFLVQSGKEDAFERWMARYLDASAAVPGHLAAMRLDQPARLVHVVHRFASQADMDGWEASRDHDALLAPLEALATYRSERDTGGQTRFFLPSEGAAPKWKTWIATWVAVFPVLLTLNALVRSLPFDLSPPAQLAITSPILTALLTFFILPQVRKLLRPWLLVDSEGDLRTQS